MNARAGKERLHLARLDLRRHDNFDCTPTDRARPSGIVDQRAGRGEERFFREKFPPLPARGRGPPEKPINPEEDPSPESTRRGTNGGKLRCGRDFDEQCIDGVRVGDLPQLPQSPDRTERRRASAVLCGRAFQGDAQLGEHGFEQAKRCCFPADPRFLAQAECEDLHAAARRRRTSARTFFRNEATLRKYSTTSRATLTVEGFSGRRMKIEFTSTMRSPASHA